MLTPHAPTLLALLGTLLMAVVIFAPAPPAAKREAPCATPAAYSPLPFAALAPPADPAPPSAARWPALVDPCAGACDAGARSALADALGAVRSAWAEAILSQALEEEADPIVRAAIEAARSPWWSG